MENNLPQRKPARLTDFDYASIGTYFITICAQHRKCILSKIVGEGSPLPQLSHYGNISDKWINRLSEKYNEITVDCYVIMPNHIHLLLSVTQYNGRGNPSPTISSVIGWLKYQITKEINNSTGITANRIFQRSFYDHIVRNTDDYNEIFKYITENPIRWKFDKFYTDI